MRLALAAAALLFAACTTPYAHDAENVGKATLVPWQFDGIPSPSDVMELGGLSTTSTTLPFEVGHPLVAEVTILACPMEAEAHCTITERGDTLELAAHFAWNNVCVTRELHMLSATCVLPALSERAFLVRFADKSTTLTVPSTGPMISFEID